MNASIAKICDPRYHSLEEAIETARLAAQQSTRFELDLARFLQTQCLADHPNFPVVFRGLEVLGGIVDESRLVVLLRPFLRSRDMRILSKCVLILGRRSQSLTWLPAIMKETDDRLRANLIESLWRRREPGLEEMLKCALSDRHHRVAANAVHGLYLLGSELYEKGLERLLSSADPNFRRAAIWALREGDGRRSPLKFKPLIRDPDPDVRHAVFKALAALREKSTADEPSQAEACATESRGAGTSPGPTAASACAASVGGGAAPELG